MSAATDDTVEVFVGIGSNIDAEKNLGLATRELTARFGAIRTSSIYRSRAVGFDGADFLNMVVAFRTAEPPETILAVLDRLHDLAGRAGHSEPFSSRTLDVDLLLYGASSIEDSRIRVPREDILKYAFVLAPLAELAPDLQHPVIGSTMAELWAQFDRSDQTIEKLSSALDA